MKTIHIVGQKGSFTHAATLERYGNKYDFKGYSHHDLVMALIEKKILKGEISIVPLWNSNTGVIDMEQVTRTTRVFHGDADRICDLWPHPILFQLAIPDGKFCALSRIFSVKVAAHQCSKFLGQNGVLANKRFIGSNTTTDAMNDFQKNRHVNDGVLCDEKLLQQNGFKALHGLKVTNANNMTIFATIGKPPNSRDSTKYFLGCFSTLIEGHELPVEFVDYYERLVARSLSDQSQDVITSIPKIIFIVRDVKGSRVFMLLEMPTAGERGVNWEPPDVETSIDVVEVGELYQSYSSQATGLMHERFKCDKFCFYGAEGCYMWICPLLQIAVHGFDKDLVREAARMQVLRLQTLANEGRQMAAGVKKTLNSDLVHRSLLPDSSPVTPNQ